MFIQNSPRFICFRSCSLVKNSEDPKSFPLLFKIFSISFLHGITSITFAAACQKFCLTGEMLSSWEGASLDVLETMECLLLPQRWAFSICEHERELRSTQLSNICQQFLHVWVRKSSELDDAKNRIFHQKSCTITSFMCVGVCMSVFVSFGWILFYHRNSQTQIQTQKFMNGKLCMSYTAACVATYSCFLSSAEEEKKSFAMERGSKIIYVFKNLSIV